MSCLSCLVNNWTRIYCRAPSVGDLKFALTYVGIGIMALAASTVTAGPLGTVDDFSDATLSEYTLRKILDQEAGTSNISFSSPDGVLLATSTGATGAEQVLFFRNDFTLAQGEELQVDGPMTESGDGTNDIGIAVGQTPVGLGEAAGDNRSMADYLFISYRNPTQLNSRGFNGGTEVGQIQAFGVTADSLFISRLANNDMELGYYTGTTRTVVRTVTPATTNIYNNLGFYSDLRADAAMMSGLDDLRIVIPSSGIDGDYNDNGAVDAADYVLWREGGPLENGRATRRL
jgi:hypothetical protein